jgi:hypothetical protein
LFVDLLYEMADALGYDEFDKNQIRKLSYSPIAHETIETQDLLIRAGFANILSGNASFPMRVTAWPLAEPTAGAPPDSTPKTTQVATA